mgnify:CR=1 FL=1
MRVIVPEAAWAERRQRVLEFPETWEVKVYPMRGYEEKPVSKDQIIYALRNPMGSKSLKELAKGKEEVAIVFDDITRPTRVRELAEAVVRELIAAGIKEDDIRFIAALGAHRAMTREEFVKKLGADIVERHPVYNHDPFFSCEYLGETSYGTPVEVNGEYASCDLKIGIGCIVPHPMLGFGGGAKILLPGVASINAIKHNHGVIGGYKHGSKPHPSTGWGKWENNVMKKDAEEFAKIAGLDFKIDVLVNGFNDSVGIYAGDFMGEHKQGIAKARDHYSSDVPADHEVIILNTSAKANEASVALSNWYPFLKPGSIVVLIANPPDGQITHYVFGKFGKKISGILYTPPRRLDKIKKLIIYSEHLERDPHLPIARSEDVCLIKNWEEVIEEISSTSSHIKVAVIPNAEIQCPRTVLKPAP